MNEKTRWADNLNDEQRGVLGRACDTLEALGFSENAKHIRAAFAAKPRERVGWIHPRGLEGVDGYGIYSVGHELSVRVSVTEIMGDDSEAQS